MRSNPLSVIGFSLLALLTVCASVSNATVLTFTSRAAFQNASTNLQSTDFEQIVGTAMFPNNYHAGIGYENFSPLGIVVDGTGYLGLGDFGTEVYILSSTVGSGEYKMFGDFSFVGGRTITTITPPSGTTAIGFDYGFDDKRTGGLSITLTLAGGGQVIQNVLVSQPNQFIGFAGDAIASIELNSGGRGYFPYTLLDNVSVGLATVPEPSSMAIYGFAGIACLIWRINLRNRETNSSNRFDSHQS